MAQGRVLTGFTEAAETYISFQKCPSRGTVKHFWGRQVLQAERETHRGEKGAGSEGEIDTIRPCAEALGVYGHELLSNEAIPRCPKVFKT